MKKISTLLLALVMPLLISAQGWPEKYKGVMLQAFYWDSFTDTQWSNLENQADEIAEFFNLMWIPQSGNCGNGPSMGYNDLFWFSNYTSSFGTEDQLRSMINTLKNRGVGTIADVVINHRNSNSGWMGFPEETYNGKTYVMKPEYICSNDDGGATKQNAEIKPTGNLDTGDDFGGFRDIDHTNVEMQQMIIDYLNFLKNDLGYAGFRYDMVKGYAGKYIKLYNETVKPEFSVGEYWDGNYNKLSDWINSTGKESAVFDFNVKYMLNDACNGNNWNKLNQWTLPRMGQGRYSVTFVDNHDTYRDNNKVAKNQMAANAFILSTPGTPCVFLSHWKMYKEEIKNLIYARNLAGITNESKMDVLGNATNETCAFEIKGDNANLHLYMGKYTANDEGVCVAKGENYAVYISNKVNSAWTDKPSGKYKNNVDVVLSSISEDKGAQVVYTLDGTDPSLSNGTKVASGTSINISSSCVLKAAILAGGVVKGMVTRNYKITNFKPYEVTVHLKDPSWSDVYFYSWDGNGELLGSWPGKRVTDTKIIDGVKWYCQTFNIPDEDYKFNIIFDQGMGKQQTVDIIGINTDKYYEIGEMSNGKLTYKDVTSTLGIGDIIAVDGVRNTSVYSISGCMLRKLNGNVSVEKAMEGLAKGIYIINGKKYVKR